MATINLTAAAVSSGQGLVSPRAAHALDNGALLSYLKHHVPGLVSYSGDLQVFQFSHGQSNPTYLLHLANLRLVLRKKPPGKLLASAHAVEREYQVLSALSDTPVPVPKVLVCCDDSHVIGTPFYIMEFVDGQIYLDPNLPQVAPTTRTAMYRQLASALAALHTVDPDQLGLQSFGKTANYCKRQLQRWRTQYLASVHAPMPAMLALMAWLQAHPPPPDSSPSRPCVIHGDYRLDNCVFGGGGGLKAVLDWELATLGNPWADVAYCCMNLYRLPEGMPVMQSARKPFDAGIPPESQFLSWYCEARNCSLPSEQEWAFYLALSIFRVVAILAGVQARAKQGNASSANAARVASDEVLQLLLDTALDIIRQSETTSAQAARNSGLVAMEVLTSDGGGAHTQRLRQQVAEFVKQHVIPVESIFEAHSMSDKRWTVHPLMEELKKKARSLGLWNLWLPKDMAAKLQHLHNMCADEHESKTLLGAGLSNLQYAIVCEEMGRCLWAPEVFNCSAPDTGNMEVLARYGSREQQACWLLPLLQGRIRSCFAMTEMAVASSDATNIQASIVREGREYVLNGVKWWTSGASDPRCAVSIFMGKTAPTAAPHQQQSMVLVPMQAPGVRVVRPLLVYGIDDAPHGHAEVHFKDVRVPLGNMILGEGRGFEIAQGRLGPGRLHHCMRLIGHAERAMDLMVQRALSRTVFGKKIAQQGAFQSDLAKCRIELDAARLLVLNAAHTLDQCGNKAARGALAAAKVAVPNTALRVIDRAVQVHGGAGVGSDTPLSRLWINARTLRIADGPDEVHLQTLAKLELARASRL